MMYVFFTIAALLASPAHPPGSAPARSAVGSNTVGANAVGSNTWIGLDPEQLAPALKQIHDEEPDFAARVLAISRHFVGAPYRFSPLGEGAGQPPDEDPLFQTSEFDCLSLVEISLALASSPDVSAALAALNAIRYEGGEVAFAARKHLVESQWIPENVKAGWLRDITREVAPDEAVRVQKIMSPAIYAKRKKALELDLPEARIPRGTFRWWVVPLDKMQDVAPRIPSGALVFIVREDFFSIPTRISHVGIAVQRGGQTLLRHAKDVGLHKVVDMPLAEVIKRHTEFVKWPVTGFAIYLPTAPNAPARRPQHALKR